MIWRNWLMSWRRLVSTRKGCFMMKALTTGTKSSNTCTIHNNYTIMLILNIYFRFKLLETKLESTLKSTLEIKEEKIAALEARLQESSNLNQQLRQELKTVSSMHANPNNPHLRTACATIHSLHLCDTLRTQMNFWGQCIIYSCPLLLLMPAYLFMWQPWRMSAFLLSLACVLTLPT